MADDLASSPNAAQVEYWNTAAGQTWASHHDLLDRQVGPLGLEALTTLAPRPGERVLDIGCGCGHTTVELAARVGPGGAVIGIDVSTPMLAIARRRALAPGSGRVEFLRADAQSADLGRARFEAAYSRFGVMFFTDPVAAFARIRRALTPGGRLAFVCWRPLAANRWMLEPLEAARPFLPPLPPFDPNAPGPFAFADDARVRHILEAGGYTEVAVRPHDTTIGGGTLEEALTLALRVGPLGAAIRENPACEAHLAGAVRAVLERHVTPHGVLMPAAVWIASARAPAAPASDH